MLEMRRLVAEMKQTEHESLATALGSRAAPR